MNPTPSETHHTRPGDPSEMADALLAWYDRHARDLPWRIGPAARAAGVRPDPYRVWLSEIMLQQTTVAAAGPYFRTFTDLWPDVAALAGAEDDAVMGRWAGLGYYARARNLLKCARIVAEAGGFPGNEAGLLTLPGIGPYTAAAIAAIAYDQPAVVMDGNVERVMARQFAIETPLPAAKPELRAAAARLTPEHRPGDYAQALMDLGATVCTPRKPACGLCPWMATCAARLAGTAQDLPRKAAKQPKPVRRGVVFVAIRADGALLLERRPETGLLGGMMGLPGGDWAQEPPETPPPFPADWTDAGAEARHVFTHFALRLRVLCAHAPMEARPAKGAFAGTVKDEAPRLPTVFRKALKIGADALRDSCPH